jgi:hypothetical protein
MFLIRLQTFLKSLLWHISNGLPKSSKQQINYRFSICSDCEFYDGVNDQCLHCGCNISNKSIFLNKLAWADQQCPINKWSAL